MVFVAERGMDVLSRNLEDYPEGIIVPVDKPYRWTSADVVRKLKFAAKKHFGQKNIKVGHAGTLDPLATGVLVVCIGKATRLAEQIQASDKEYVAGITFGATTPSFDLEKPIDKFYPTDGVTEGALNRALEGFIGEQEQVAPVFSAKLVDGVRSYKLARKGLATAPSAEVATTPSSEVAKATSAEEAAPSSALLRNPIRENATEGTASSASMPKSSIIRINDIALLSFRPHSSLSFRPSPSLSFRPSEARGEISTPLRPLDCARGDKELIARGDKEMIAQGDNNPSSRINVTDNSGLGLPHAEIRVSCSKGTYIRALARDLGASLDSGAHLDSLYRTACGNFTAEKALNIQEAIALFNQQPQL